jgi:membrane-associated phospholipid phosphatase
VSAAIGRSRPDVPRLDPAPPTSSYPSGHVGASVALYTSLAVMATTIERTWLRRTVIDVCSVIPFLVAYARLYRGMHHLSDVIVGAINGLVCAGLAAGCLVRRRSETTETDGQLGNGGKRGPSA